MYSVAVWASATRSDTACTYKDYSDKMHSQIFRL